MKNDTTDITEKQKAIDEGFIEEFVFSNNRLRCLLFPEQTYAMCQVVVKATYCPVDECTVYRIKTPAGIPGYAIIKIANALKTTSNNR